jgi:hypothetical protein
MRNAGMTSPTNPRRGPLAPGHPAFAGGLIIAPATRILLIGILCVTVALAATAPCAATEVVEGYRDFRLGMTQKEAEEAIVKHCSIMFDSGSRAQEPIAYFLEPHAAQVGPSEEFQKKYPNWLRLHPEQRPPAPVPGQPPVPMITPQLFNGSVAAGSCYDDADLAFKIRGYRFNLNDQTHRLEKISIQLGPSTADGFKETTTFLAGKYGLSHPPSEEQIEDFKTGRSIALQSYYGNYQIIFEIDSIVHQWMSVEYQSPSLASSRPLQIRKQARPFLTN